MNPAATRVREALRQRIDCERLLAIIEDVEGRLLCGWERSFDPATGKHGEWVPLTSARVSALNTVLSAQFAKLKKVLPDLKAVELTGEDGQPLGATDNLALATKLLRLMREERPEVIEGEKVPEFLQ